jgi:hypothetical protein
MRRHNGPRQGWLWRSLRRTGFARSPMRRRTDRVQAITRAGLLAVFLAGAPAAAACAGHAAYVSGLRAVRAEQAWHPVPAVVLRAARTATGWLYPVRPPRVLSVRWRSSGGASRLGAITSTDDVRIGGTVTVWIDETGRLAHRPLSRAKVTGHVIGAVVAVVAALALLLAIVSGVVSLLLDRCRLARWEADWAAVEPQWTRRY